MTTPTPQRVEKEMRGLLQDGMSFPAAAKLVLDGWNVPQEQRPLLLVEARKHLLGKSLLLAQLKWDIIEALDGKDANGNFWNTLKIIQYRWSLQDKEQVVLDLIRDYHRAGKKIVLTFREQCLLTPDNSIQDGQIHRLPKVVVDPKRPHSGQFPLFRETLDD